MRQPPKFDSRVTTSGFGLIELIVTVAIVAILATIALPSFATVLRSNRVASHTNDLLNAINLARNEAITRTRGVSVCAASTASGVPSACGSNWNLGWIVFLDSSTGSAAPVVGTVLKAWQPNAQNQLSTLGAQTYIRFSARGEALANPVAPVTFKLKPASNCADQQQRSIVITALGRSSSVKTNCS